jgi:zinc and cadmium transporter
VALAASVEAEAHEVGSLAGFGTFLVVFCHKPFDSLTLGTLLARGGWSPRWRHAVNAAFALAILLGVAAFHVGLSGARADNRALLAYALAFAAGTFLCIAMSDLLPELQFHHHDRAKLSAALLLGLAVAWSVGLFERHGHDRDHDDDRGHDGHYGHESRSVSPPSVLAPHARALPPP